MAVRKLEQEFDDAMKTATDDAQIAGLVGKLQAGAAAITETLATGLAAETAQSASNVATVSADLQRAVDQKLRVVKVEADLAQLIVATENAVKRVGTAVGEALTVIRSDTEAAAVVAAAKAEATAIQTSLDTKLTNYVAGLPEWGLDAAAATA